MSQTSLQISQQIELDWRTDWLTSINSAIDGIIDAFERHPHWFFTESDIHSALYNITMEELGNNGFMETSDGHEVSLVHHEYPTPFRCDMDKLGFTRKDEPPFRRGHYDLVMLNPEFVKSNTLPVVRGKNFRKFTSAMKKIEVSPLIWACEVMFFHRINKNTPRIIKQDALKVKETLSFKVGKDTSFCDLGSVLVFTDCDTKKALALEEKTKKIKQGLKSDFHFTSV